MKIQQRDRVVSRQHERRLGPTLALDARTLLHWLELWRPVEQLGGESDNIGVGAEIHTWRGGGGLSGGGGVWVFAKSVLVSEP